MAIGSMLLLLISNFFHVNLVSYKRLDAQAEVQYQAQIAMEFLVSRMIRSEGIDFRGLVVNQGYTLDNNQLVNLSKTNKPVKLRDLYFYRTGDGQEYFSHDNLTFAYSKEKNEISSFIKEIIIEPVPTGNNYQGCAGLNITITVEKEHENITLNTEIYFRNKKK